ncbi:MAG: hypothetical protein RL128_1814, partial [Pseudomonadota bacterium]
MNAQNPDISADPVLVPEIDSTATTAMATETTMLNPRFYTTDFDEMDRVDVSSIRPEWDKLIAQMKSDPNKGHFKKNADWDQIDWAAMDPKLRVEFIDFLVSSCTAEFSGCVLYKEMKRRGNNPDICELFNYMARDEARHAGFINDALREAGVAVNLGFLTKAKKYTYFRPKFIYYATYLSEKIGYARYITIYRHLEANPDQRFHPIFSFVNKLWIRFFLTAVYSTMFVRDHARPEFHKALGVDIEWYDQEVFRKTSVIARQVFPIEVDIDHPRWLPNLRRMRDAFGQMDEAKRRGGVAGWLGKVTGGAKALTAFVALYTIPVIKR